MNEAYHVHVSIQNLPASYKHITANYRKIGVKMCSLHKTKTTDENNYLMSQTWHQLVTVERQMPLNAVT